MILLSATQINLYTECPRKWGFRYLDGLKQEPGPGQLLGIEVQDEQIDPWLSTGRQFDFSRPTHSGEIALALAPLLPAPMAEGMRLRRWFTIPSPSGDFGYQGEMDLWAPDSRIVPGLSLARGRAPAPLVADIKSIKDLRYAKSKKDLLTDPQAQLYAMTTMYEDNVDAVDLVWFYTRTRSPWRVQRAVVRVEAAHVAEQFSRIDAIGAEIAAIKQASSKASELPPTGAKPRRDLGGETICNSFGGCPYRHICNISPATFAAGWEVPLSDPNTSSFLQSLKKVVPHTNLAAEVPKATVVEVKPLAANASIIQALREVSTPVNPPESALPPAPPVGAVASSASPTAARGRPKGAPVVPPQGLDWVALVATMRELGVKRLVLEGPRVEIEILT